MYWVDCLLLFGPVVVAVEFAAFKTPQVLLGSILTAALSCPCNSTLRIAELRPLRSLCAHRLIKLALVSSSQFKVSCHSPSFVFERFFLCCVVEC